MKAILTFNLSNEDDNYKYKACMQGVKAKLALWDISQEVLRPTRKHGYSDQELQDLIEKNPDAVEIISRLETKFYEIITNYGVEIE